MTKSILRLFCIAKFIFAGILSKENFYCRHSVMTKSILAGICHRKFYFCWYLVIAKFIFEPTLSLQNLFLMVFCHDYAFLCKKGLLTCSFELKIFTDFEATPDVLKMSNLKPLFFYIFNTYFLQFHIFSLEQNIIKTSNTMRMREKERGGGFSIFLNFVVIYFTT